MRCPECEVTSTAIVMVGNGEPLTTRRMGERVEPARQVFEPCGHPVPPDFAWQTPTFSTAAITPVLDQLRARRPE